MKTMFKVSYSWKEMGRIRRLILNDLNNLRKVGF